jgi:uncharacterized protein
MKLKWSLMELNKYKDSYFPLEGKADLTNSLKKRKQELIDASLVDINGMIDIQGNKRYYVDLTLNVTLTLPSSRSLEPVDIDLHIPFSEVYLAPDALGQDLEEFDETSIFSLEQDILDLQKPIEDTILASIPMKVLSEEEVNATELPTGNDWELSLEDETDSKESTESSSPENSPFNVLKGMFDEADEN